MAKINNPLIVLKGGGGGMELYHVVQTINGDECSLSISDYDPAVTTDNYLLDFYVQDDSQDMYIFTPYNGGA